MTLKTFRNAAARLSRREWLKATSASVGAGLVAARSGRLTAAPAVTSRDLRIKEVRITPVALPDPPHSGGLRMPRTLLPSQHH